MTMSEILINPVCPIPWSLVEPSEAPKDTGGATKASAEYHLPDYTEPEPSTARAPEAEGEAT